MIRILFVLFVASIFGCVPSPGPLPPRPPDASDAAPEPTTADAAPVVDDCARACAALAAPAVACTMGTRADCWAFLSRDLGTGKVPNPTNGKPMTCATVAAVQTKADAVRLGFVCP